MLCKIFKEVGKYLVFLLLITSYHTFNKYIVEENFSLGEVKVSSSEKTGANIYKDEDDYDDV